MQINICLSTPALARALVLGSFCALALTGCGGSGGGGGDSTVAVAPPTVAVPPVTTTSPTTPATTPITAEIPSAPSTTTPTPTSPGTSTTPTSTGTSVTTGATETTSTPPTTTTTPTPVIRASISLLAGRVSGGPGNIDGIGTGARFAEGIGGMAKDAAGNLYVADTKNLTLRKVSPTGVVTTLAGRAVTLDSLDEFGRRIGVIPVDGQGGEARFNEPAGVAVDSTGTIYVMDLLLSTIPGVPGRPVIRKVSPTGMVTTLKLGSEAEGWRIDTAAIAVDMANNLYVTARDFQTNPVTAVLKINPFGSVAVLASSPPEIIGSSAGSQANLTSPFGIAVDSVGSVYVGDGGRLVSRKISPSGVVTYFPPVASPPGYFLAGERVVAVDATDNVLIVSTRGNVKWVSPAGQVISSFNMANAYRTFAAAPSGGFYFTEGPEIKKVDASGLVTSWVGGKSRSNLNCGPVEVGTGVGVCEPAALAADSAGSVYVGRRFIQDVNPNGCGFFDCFRVNGGGAGWKVSPLGMVSSAWTSPSVTPERVAIDSNGVLYVGTTHIHARPDYISVQPSDATILKLSAQGLKLGEVSIPRSQYSVGGLVRYTFDYIASRLREFAVDASGNMAIAYNSRVLKISLSGLTTEFGVAGSPGAVDGPGDTARFSEISALAFDPAGNIFVADRDNHAIRKISPAGIVSTVVGKLGSSGIVLGDLPGSLYQPNGLAFDKEGMLYISSGDAILKVKLP